VIRYYKSRNIFIKRQFKLIAGANLEYDFPREAIGTDLGVVQALRNQLLDVTDARLGFEVIVGCPSALPEGTGDPSFSLSTPPPIRTT
jgi:hypothetical protein